MIKKTAVALAMPLVVVLALVTRNEAQQPATKLRQIGVLYPGLSGTSPPQLEGFQQGLRELGYIKGKNIAIEYRFAEEKPDRLPELATELVGLKVDVIVAAGGTPSILAAKNATSSIPIVFPTVGDPVALGFVASLARPGGNITGLTNWPPEFSGKMLELLREVVPRTTRVAVLGQEANPSNAVDFKSMEAAASGMGLQLHHIEVRGSNDFENAFSKITDTVHATALFVQASIFFTDNRRRIADLAAKSRLPAISNIKEFTEAGVLMSYGPDRFDQGRRAAIYVDKILKGAKPANLPVEQPRKFEFVINLKTATEIGVTIPPNVLAQADKVIR